MLGFPFSFPLGHFALTPAHPALSSPDPLGLALQLGTSWYMFRMLCLVAKQSLLRCTHMH